MKEGLDFGACPLPQTKPAACIIENQETKNVVYQNLIHMHNSVWNCFGFNQGSDWLSIAQNLTLCSVNILQAERQCLWMIKKLSKLTALCSYYSLSIF